MNVIERIQTLKKILKEAERIVAWQEDIYAALNTLTGKTKAGNVTDTTSAAGLISVTFATAFSSTPVVIVQLEGDVDYYCVVTARSATGFTVKMLKTAHKHSQGNTGGEAAHTHGISFASGAGSAHKHSNPNTSDTGSHYHYKGTFLNVGEAAHTHGISFASGADGAHTHTQGVTGTPNSAWFSCPVDADGMSTFTDTGSVDRENVPYGVHLQTMAKGDHTHTNPDTSNEPDHTHSVSGTSGAGSSHTHNITGTTSTEGSHVHTIADTGNESAHTHGVSGTSGTGGGHSHTNPDTAEVNAGNLLATTAVTFSYIAMIP